MYIPCAVEHHTRQTCLASSFVKGMAHTKGARLPQFSLDQSDTDFTQNAENSQQGSDDEGDDWRHNLSSLQRHEELGEITDWVYMLRESGLGRCLFSTSIGWAIRVSLLVLLLWGGGAGFAIFNRIIAWSSYLMNNYTAETRLLYIITRRSEFPYPLTTIWLQMIVTHLVLLLSASFTRWKSQWFRDAGLAGLIAPTGWQTISSANLDKGKGKEEDLRPKFAPNGIAGGGLLEFDLTSARQTLLVTCTFVAGSLLATLSSTFSHFSTFALSRIGIVPLSLSFTIFLEWKQSRSVMFSTLAATLSLGIALYLPNVEVHAGSVVLGIASSFFSALYPLQLSRTYSKLHSETFLSSHDISGNPTPGSDYSGSPEEARAFWRMLHYISFFSLIIFTPIVLVSGEVPSFLKKYSTLHIYSYWLMILLGGLANWIIFVSTISLTRATSSLTAAFISIPQASLLLPILVQKALPLHSWIGLVLCWLCCGWFMVCRITEELQLNQNI